MRRGRRVSSQHLVLHFLTRPECPAPRAGFVVGKIVGNSVQRHRVIRQLRHLVRDRIADFAPGTEIVLRGLAGAHDADLAGELSVLLRKAGIDG
jgi:ribonuclease P protein component